MEKTYGGKTPAALLAELMQMSEESAGLKGAFDLEMRRFSVQEAQAARLRAALEGLKQPDVTVLQITRPEDVEQAVKSTQLMIDYYAARASAIQALIASLDALVKQAGECVGDGAVSEQYLFKMQVAADLLNRSGPKETPARVAPSGLSLPASAFTAAVAAVQGAVQKAHAEGLQLDKQLAEAKAAGDDAAARLTNLRQSQEATLYALQWESQVKAIPTTQAVGEFTSTAQQLQAKLNALKPEEDAFEAALATMAEGKKKLAAINDLFLRLAEQQGAAERQRTLDDLRKEAGLEHAAGRRASSRPWRPRRPRRPRRLWRPAPRPGDVPAGVKAADEKKVDPEAGHARPRFTGIEVATQSLQEFQQLVAGRVRVLDEQDARQRDLLANLNDLEQKTNSYVRTLTKARQLATREHLTAIDLKLRVGRGDLAADAIPDGVTASLGSDLLTHLDASAASVLNAQGKIRHDRDAMARPNPAGDASKALSREVLSLVGRRLDLLADLKRLSEDYRRDKKDRPASEIKRLEELAAERQSAEMAGLDRFLSLGADKKSASLAELLETYYRELIELEEKQDNLCKQKEAVDELLDLAQKETTAVARARPLLAEQIKQCDAARDEEWVTARVRLHPEAADELLRNFQAQSGRQLARPVPIPQKDRADKIEALAAGLFGRYVEIEAIRLWDQALDGRLSPSGIAGESGIYQDELATLKATTGANDRRIRWLTGRAASDPATSLPTPSATAPALAANATAARAGAANPAPVQAAAWGEIDKTRDELSRVRRHDAIVIGIKIAIVLFLALLLPRVIIGIMGRAVVKGDGAEPHSGLVLSSLQAFAKAIVWLAALAIILNILGFDITAILAGLGIGGLAIGLAAQPMIADVIGAVIIFVERRFTIGDVIGVGSDEPAKVVGVSWRMTQVKNSDGLISNVPNRNITEQIIQNLTRAGRTYDGVNVVVTTAKNVNDVVDVIKEALNACKYLAPTADRGVSVKEFSHQGNTKVIKYRFWWYLNDYDRRDSTRDEVFNTISDAWPTRI